MIGQPYKRDADDAALVAEFDALPDEARTGDYWSLTRVDGFKAKAKAFYITAQDRRCCYCTKEIVSDNKRMWDLDHVLSRDKCPEYMFVSENLAISCVDCNIAKSAKDVAKGKAYKNFPRRSSSYRIVHPHFDIYDEHIRVFAGLIYVPVGGSKKGRETITVCNLSRYGDVFQGKMGAVCDTRYEADVAQLLFATERDEALAAARKLLTAFDDGPLA